MKNRRTYNYAESHRLTEYVRRHFFKTPKEKIAMPAYEAIAKIENKRKMFCQPFSCTYRDLAENGNIHKNSIKKALLLLEQSGVCEIHLGSPIKKEKKATVVRRKGLQELKKTQKPNSSDADVKIPENTQLLTDHLSSRKFIYAGKEVLPTWSPNHIGRIYSKKNKQCDFNVITDKAETRVENLMTGLKPGEILLDIDYKSAEPTVIKHAIGISDEFDIYQIIVDKCKVSRVEAKKMVGFWHYFSGDMMVLLRKEYPQLRSDLGEYARRLNMFQNKLFEEGKPVFQKDRQNLLAQGLQAPDVRRRTVKVLTGHRIEVKPGEDSPNRGQCLSWYAQGTVASFITEVCLKIIELEEARGWRLLYPVHDSAYIICQGKHVRELRKIFKRVPLQYGVSMTVNTSQYPDSD